MIRITLILLMLMTALVPASAQDSLAVRRIEVPLFGAETALSPDGATLAVYVNPVMIENEVTPEALPIHLYDVATGELKGTLEGTQVDLVRDVAFSPDGAQLASYHINGDLILWDVAAQTVLQQVGWLPIGGGIIDFMPDGENVVMMANNGQVGQQTVFNFGTSSITNILSLKPETYAAFQEETGNMEVMGTYMIAAQAIDADGDIYSSTANDEVFVWDADTHERISLYPSVEGNFMRFGVRKFHFMADNTVVFYSQTAAQTVMIAPDGAQSELPFGSAQFTVSPDGLLAYYDRDAEQVFVAELNGNAEPETLPVTFEATDQINPLTSLAFMPDGDLIIAGLRTEDDGSAIYVVDMP